MDMIREHDEGVDRKRLVLPRRGNGLAQERDMVDEQGLPPLQQINRKEPAAARHESATIVWHGERLSHMLRRCRRGGGLRYR